MAKALLILNDNSLRVVEPDKALHYWQVLNGIIEPTEADAEKVMHIRHVSLPPSHRPNGYTPVIPNRSQNVPRPAVRSLDDENTAPTQTSLTNPGIEQGKSQALPTGDR